MMLPNTAAASVKRVVSCFILSNPASRESLRIAVFQRQSTMPTFPSHWAGVSGSIEIGEQPWQTAVRELQEETNLVPNACSDDEGVPCEFVHMGGLYLEVPFKPNRNIRVYPFVVQYKEDASMLELRGTEHDTHQFISVQDLEQLEPAVPGLAQAFHHATHGQYLARNALPASVWKWSEDRVNGATTLARQAIRLVVTEEENIDLSTMAMLRPTMVPIVNVLRAFEQKLEQGKDKKAAGEAILASIDEQVEQSISLGVQALEKLFDATQPFTIATFSRSSTLLKLLQRFLKDHNNIRILSAKSTPGDEGELMAQDLQKHCKNVECLEDDALHQAILDSKVDVVLVGCDCLLADRIVNKVGTKALAETCAKSPTTSILCCADRWKLWQDEFPPPLEDIFECVPRELLDQVIVPDEV